MVMQLGKRYDPGLGLGSTRWTSTVPTPFGPAPGGGSFGGMFESGFAADPVIPAPPPGQTNVVMDPTLALVNLPITVKKEPVAPENIPSAVIRYRYTDTGLATKAKLDRGIADLFKKAGFKVSRTTSFKPVNVTWRWYHDKKADFYYPIVVTPTSLQGIKYTGNAIVVPAHSATAEALAKLPNQIWIYTVGVTSAQNTMSDGEAAHVLTVLKQADINYDANAYATIEMTIRGCPPDLFGPVKTEASSQLLKASMSGLILLAAWNMIAPHIGSERL